MALTRELLEKLFPTGLEKSPGNGAKDGGGGNRTREMIPTGNGHKQGFFGRDPDDDSLTPGFEILSKGGDGNSTRVRTGFSFREELAHDLIAEARPGGWLYLDLDDIYLWGIPPHIAIPRVERLLAALKLAKEAN